GVSIAVEVCDALQCEARRATELDVLRRRAGKCEVQRQREQPVVWRLNDASACEAVARERIFEVPGADIAPASALTVTGHQLPAVTVLPLKRELGRKVLAGARVVETIRSDDIEVGVVVAIVQREAYHIVAVDSCEPDRDGLDCE